MSQISISSLTGTNHMTIDCAFFCFLAADADARTSKAGKAWTRLRVGVAQQNGTAYVWNSTTQELLPILPRDHPNFRENSALLVAAFRRWNGAAK